MKTLFVGLAWVGLTSASLAQETEMPESMTGYWTDGARVYSLFENGYGAVEYLEKPGAFSILQFSYENGIFEFTDIDGISPCTGLTAQYSVATGTNGLILRPISEPCEARKGPVAVPLKPYRPSFLVGEEESTN